MLSIVFEKTRRRIYFSQATLGKRLHEMERIGLVSLAWNMNGEWECKIAAKNISCVGYGAEPHVAVYEAYYAWISDIGIKARKETYDYGTHQGKARESSNAVR